jgi:hypothetical protein
VSSSTCAKPGSGVGWLSGSSRDDLQWTTSSGTKRAAAQLRLAAVRCGRAVEKIARLAGHTGTATTELVYRKQIRPVVTGGAAVMDQLFPRRDGNA